MRNPSCCSSSINSESSETFRIIIHQCKIAQRKNFLQVLQRFTIPFFNHALWYPMSAMLHTIPHTFFRNFNRIYTYIMKLNNVSFCFCLFDSLNY